MEDVEILKVNTADAAKNINDLKENIKNLKKELNDAKKDFSSAEGMKEYNALIQLLQQNQNALRDAMHGTATAWKGVTDAATMANVEFDTNNKLVAAETISYNELVHKLADLKQAWRATTDATERTKLGEQINSVNDRLKALDASTGSYVRNVGNYKSALEGVTAGMASMGKGAAAAVNPIKGVTLGLQTMSKTPLIAILGILVNVLAKIVAAMKSNEQGAQNLNKALAPFNAIADVLTGTLQKLGDVVVGLVSGFVKLAESIFGSNKATERRLELAKQEAQLATQQRETIVKNAEDERDIAILRANSADRLKYTAQERLGFLKEAGEKEKEIAARALQDAKLQYEIIKAKNALTRSSKQDLDAEAQAYANLLKVETQYYNTIKSINAGITRATREEATSARAAMKEREEARKAELESYKALLGQEIALLQKTDEERLARQKELLKKEYESAVASAKDKIKNEETLNRTLLALRTKYHKDIRLAERDFRQALRTDELLTMENLANTYEKGSTANLRAVKELRLKELESLEKMEGETTAEYNKRKIAAQWAYIEALKALNAKVVGETIEPLRLAYAESAHTTEQTLAYEQALAEAAVANIQALGREVGESETGYLARLAEAQKTYADKTTALLEYQARQEVLAAENRMNAFQEGSLEYLQEAVNVKRVELDTLHKMESESEEEFRARQLAADKAYYDAKRALAEGYISTMQTVAGSVSGILGSIADMYENNTEATKEQAIKAKNLRIASATIDMLSGVVTAISTAQQLGPIAGPIVAAANSAAVLAAGMANIAKIRAQQVSTSGATTATPETPASVSAPSVAPSVQQVRTLTGASEEDRLNRMAAEQRVYILASDIEASQSERKVRIRETTF